MILLGVGEQLVEVVFVTIDRFHYTMDIYIAIVLTFLLYSNVVPSMLAKRWMFYGVNTDPNTQAICDVFESQADVLIPWCCVPFLAGRYHQYDDEHLGQLRDCALEKYAKGMDRSREKYEMVEDVFTERNRFYEGVDSRFLKPSISMQVALLDQDHFCEHVPP